VVGRAFLKRWPARWLFGSLLLHTLLLGSIAGRHHDQVEAARSAATTQADTQLDVEVEVAPPEPDSASVAGARELEPAHAGVAHPRVSQVTAAAGEPAADGGGETTADAVDATESSPAAAASASAPHLSLAQLGVEGANPFLDRGDPAAARAAKAARVKRRLDRALTQGLMDADVARGRGAGGPVLRSLEAAVYASSAPLNGQASFVFTIDSEGKLVSSVLGDASTDREAWARVARQTAQAFVARKLSVPKGKGVKLTVAVTSHLELPSGADPGFEISTQGIPLKKGGGPRSTKLDLSIFPFPAATLAGDPADIGARPRRMVHAHVVSEEVL
jgi:hypothetical protein